MEQKNINTVTLLLTAVAGYCDTVTFVAGDNIFSAHVTGNFIVFAYQMVNGSDINAWIKLLTFPVFIIAVMVSGWLFSNPDNKNKILLTEALLLIFGGILAFSLRDHLDQKIVSYSIVMIVVFALGLQNAFGKLFSKATHGPTTMMTGNVTQASLDMGSIIFKGFKTNDSVVSLKKQALTLFGFLIGCISGALAGKTLGLSAILIAGAFMLLCYFLSGHTKVKNT